MAKKEQNKENSAMSVFSLRQLAKLSRVDYFRIYHVVTGNRKDGFTQEETEKLSKAIIKNVNQALQEIGSKNRVTSIE